MHRVLRRIVLCLCFWILALAPNAARAGFIASTSGAINVISPPASAVPGALVSNNYQAWSETSGALSAPLQLDMLGQPGNYDGLTNFSSLGGTLPAGTQYSSGMVQFDPSTSVPAQSPIASITFTGKIIGLALFGPSLDASDIYGNPTTAYPNGLPSIGTQGRGINRTHDNRFSITNDGYTLNLQLSAGFGGFEEIRIFTAAVAAVPEPASLAIWSGIGLVVALERRKVWNTKRSAA
jgi:hypothetical protein